MGMDWNALCSEQERLAARKAGRWLSFEDDMTAVFRSCLKANDAYMRMAFGGDELYEMNAERLQAMLADIVLGVMSAYSAAGLCGEDGVQGSLADAILKNMGEDRRRASACEAMRKTHGCCCHRERCERNNGAGCA